MEEVLPPETAEGAGFERPFVRQFTVFLENKVGRLQALMRALEQGVGTVAGLSIEESGDSALVRMVCAHSDFGRELLRTAGFGFSESELLAVDLPRRARLPMSAICAALLTAEINIHYAYPLIIRPALAMYVDDAELAAQLLMKKGFTLVGETDLRKE
jgi:hypothetical protein